MRFPTTTTLCALLALPLACTGTGSHGDLAERNDPPETGSGESHVAPVSDATFAAVVLDAPGPVLVDFSAAWCEPCHVQAPILDALAEEFSGQVRFVELDVDRNPQTATRYGVQYLPTLMLFRGGRPVETLHGLYPARELRARLKAAVS